MFSLLHDFLFLDKKYSSKFYMESRMYSQYILNVITKSYLNYLHLLKSIR
jgi:hypothetical protein